MSEIGLYEAMSSTRAVRRLRPDPIPEAVLRRVLEAATWAPTGGNTQPWRVIAVTDPEKKRGLQELYIGPWEDYAASHRGQLIGVSDAVRAKQERMLDAADYNDRVAACGHNKGTLLVDETLRLLRQLLNTSRTRCNGDGLPPLEATCGRLGGRKFYGGALGSLGAVLVSTEREDKRVSRYGLQGELRGNVEFRVDADADRFLVALASMYAKYVREVYMIALNAWLTRQREGLKPTAGYGTDGRRFIRECEPILRRRGLPLASLARER